MTSPSGLKKKKKKKKLEALSMPEYLHLQSGDRFQKSVGRKEVPQSKPCRRLP